MALRVGSHEVFIDARGEGMPILILHGLNADHRSMASLLEPLFEGRRGWRRIYVDLPGHGATPSHEDLSDSDSIATLLAGVVTSTLDAGEPFAVAGLSYGAYLAWGLVDRFPQRVRGLALIVPVVAPADADRVLPERRTVRKDDEAFSSMPDESAALLRSMVSRESEEVVAAFLAHYLPALDRGDGAFIERLRTQGYSFADAPVQRFDGPALVVTGRQDPAVGYEQAMGLLHAMPQGTFVALDGAGHLAEIERPVAVRALLDDWLDRMQPTH